MKKRNQCNSKDKTITKDNNTSCTADRIHFDALTHKQYHSPILINETLFDLLASDKILKNVSTFAKAALFDDSAECKLSEKKKKEERAS